MGRSKERYRQKPWDYGNYHHGEKAHHKSENGKFVNLLAPLGIDTDKLEPVVKQSIMGKPAEVLEADINFILRRGLKGKGLRGKQRLISMLSDQNVIVGLLRWNNTNSKNSRPATYEKFPKGLLDR